jgi:hypothetical protein
MEPKPGGPWWSIVDWSAFFTGLSSLIASIFNLRKARRERAAAALPPPDLSGYDARIADLEVSVGKMSIELGEGFASLTKAFNDQLGPIRRRLEALEQRRTHGD